MRRWLWILFFVVPLAHAETANSIYNLDVRLTDQAGAERQLATYRGHPVLISMFYGSCPVACPLIIDTLRAIERAVPAQERAQLRVLLISIDPEKDTVAALRGLAEVRRIDTSRWTLARTDAASVRKIAAVLGIQYRKTPDGGFSHSSLITVLDAAGEIKQQSSVLTKADAELLAALKQSASPARR